MKPDLHETHKQHTFDSFCKKVLAHEANNGHRDINRRAAIEISMSDLPADAMEQLAVYDDYPWEHTSFPVGDDVVLIKNDRLAEALEAMPEMDICLDLYHLNRNCHDMPSFIRRYAGRICMVHFKDGIGKTLVPAGQGETRWDGVVRACLNAGVPYAFAEQETWDRDPYECLKEAMDWVADEMKKY